VKDSLLFRYGMAIVTVGIAAPITLLVSHLGQGTAPVLLAAVMLSAYFGGLGPGLLATALSAVTLDYFLPPAQTLIAGLAEGLRITVFVAVAVLISSLNAARRRLEESLRLHDARKDRFVELLAHELRAPLSALSNAVAVLRLDTNQQPNTGRIQEVMDRQIQRMVQLVNDLLDLSRIKHGKVELRREQVDLSVILAHAVDVAHPLIEARRHHLELSVPAHPIYLYADPNRLEQIVVNLLSNAVKYTEPGGHIWLVAELVDGAVLLRVRDDGCGVDEKLLPQVFELFVQGKNGSHGGLGIGLALVKSLVQLHGGEVTAHSAGPGQGTEFIVRLPSMYGATTVSRLASKTCSPYVVS
jgi:signal transduction histidine kinase